MRKSRFTETQTVEISTCTNWRAKYAGTSVAGLRRMRELEAEKRSSRVTAGQTLVSRR